MTATDTATGPRTGWEDDTPSDDSVALAALRAMSDRAHGWAEAARGSTRRDRGLVLADAGSPCLFLNVATATTAPDVATATEIAEFFPAGRPFALISPHPTVDLSPAGLQLMGHPPFMVRPAGGAAPDLPAGVTVEELHEADELAEWDRVLAEGYPMPKSPAPALLLGGPTRFWLARVDGEPAAVAMSHTSNGVVAVEAVATLPHLRRRGVGAAVTWAATLADPALPAVLIASDLGAGGYRRMGYLPVDRWTLWFRA